MATIHDVAQVAGVSTTTVSRYLNQRIELPPATSARIDAAIRKLDYRPNLLAKHLSTGRTDAIGIVAPEIDNPFFAALAAAIEDAAESHGYAVFLSSTRGLREREVACLRRLRDRHVDGLILMTAKPDDGRIAKLIRPSEPVVLIDEDIPGVDVPRVFVENELGGYVATQRLLAAGHTSIAYVGGLADLLSTRERRLGFSRAMAEANLPVPETYERFGEYTLEFGWRAMTGLLALPDPPTAIFAASDIIAIGVLQALKSRNIPVPEKMSLIGFDDMPFAQLVDPPLTTIRQPITALGQAGFNALLALMTGRTVKRETRLKAPLVERHSVAPPRKGDI